MLARVNATTEGFPRAIQDPRSFRDSGKGKKLREFRAVAPVAPSATTAHSRKRYGKGSQLSLVVRSAQGRAAIRGSRSAYTRADETDQNAPKNATSRNFCHHVEHGESQAAPETRSSRLIPSFLIGH
ncbi:hypothetical protein ISCGN_021768 [Ixodes scapularis]